MHIKLRFLNSWGAKAVIIALAGLGCIEAIIPKDAPGSKPHTEWTDYGGGPDQSKFVEFTQINKQNIATLQ